MNEAGTEVVLDEMPTPHGAVELVASRLETVWIGVRPKGLRASGESPTESAIGLHTGSIDHYVETSASIYRSWGLAFGAVSPEVERVAVRNERLDLFPARIIPLPPSFREEYRAAWGVATNCDSGCELVGYDGRDRLIAPNTVRTGERLDLSAAETLELIRRHCDNGLKYYARALEKMPSLPEQAGYVREAQNDLQALALVLAYVEGATDERAAMVEAQDIVLRYRK